MQSQVLLVSFASGHRFEEAQQRLDESLETAEIDAHWRWNSSSFKSGPHGKWHRRHSNVNFRRGGAWKPYIILQAMMRVREGDWVIYHDSSQYFPAGFSSSVRPLLAWLESQRHTNQCECIAAVRLRQQVQHEWLQKCSPTWAPYGLNPGPEPPMSTLCSMLHRIGACGLSDGADSGQRDEECCTRIAEAPMLQNSWSIWRKGPAGLQFVREWLRHAEDPEVLPHLPFGEQTLEELLLYKLHARLGLRALWAPSLYAQHWSEEHDLAHFGPLAFGRNDGTPFKSAATKGVVTPGRGL
ncbi:unnamed protein product [Prorocentrum cordatum]|uniref:Protein xylosyltransferase n=1 Tax=Prorocentrum cordatum TaxID=2364126 RepID=A0ABN9VL16_9DINO|nr:unnamed protein product [Polarella glacialis]